MPTVVERIPSTILVAFGIRIWFLLARFVMALGWQEHLWTERFILVSDGIAMAGYALTLVGLIELASRLTGSHARAVRLAAVGAFAGIVFLIGNALASFRPELWQHEWLRDLNNWAWFAATMLTVLPVAIALLERHLALAITAILFAALGAPPAVQLLVQFGTRVDLPDALMRIGALGALYALLLRFEPGEPSASNDEVAAGFRLTGAGVWLYAAGPVLGALALLLALINESRQLVNASGLVSAVAWIVGPAVIAAGLLRAARMAIRHLSRYLLVVSAAGALWVTGVALGRFAANYDASKYQLWTFAPPLDLTSSLVMLAAFACVLIAIGVHGSRCGIADLVQRARGKGIGVLILFAVSLGMCSLLLEAHDGTVLVVFAAGAISSVLAAALLAKLCFVMAEYVELEPGIPTATVVSDSP